MSNYNIMQIEEMMIRIQHLENKIKEIENYVEKMSYCEVVDNPKKDLIKILKKENK